MQGSLYASPPIHVLRKAQTSQKYDTTTFRGNVKNRPKFIYERRKIPELVCYLCVSNDHRAYQMVGSRCNNDFKHTH